MYFLGTITGASGSYNNQATGLSGIGNFRIPPNIRALYLMPSASGIFFEMGASTGSTGLTFQTTDQRGALLNGPGVLNGPYRIAGVGSSNAVVSIYNSAGGFVSCRVYAEPTS